MNDEEMASSTLDYAFPWTRWRRCSQLLVIFLFLFLPVTYRFGQVALLGTLASLKIGPVSLVDPATGLSMVLAARAVHLSLLGGMILPVLLALVLGPVFCSWVCPFGLLSELIDRLRGWGARGPSRLRWIMLALVLVASLATGLPIVATFSAPRALSVLPIELLFLGGLSLGTGGLVVIFLVLEIVLPRRLWCRALCPVGSLLVLIRSPWTLKPRWRRTTCNPQRCGESCVASCPWHLDPRHLGSFGGCTNCAACLEACPSEPVRSLGYGFLRTRSGSSRRD